LITPGTDRAKSLFRSGASYALAGVSMSVSQDSSGARELVNAERLIVLHGNRNAFFEVGEDNGAPGIASVARRAGQIRRAVLARRLQFDMNGPTKALALDAMGGRAGPDALS